MYSNIYMFIFVFTYYIPYIMYTMLGPLCVSALLGPYTAKGSGLAMLEFAGNWKESWLMGGEPLLIW